MPDPGRRIFPMAAHIVIDSNGRFEGDDLAGECKLNAPAQTELRPTFAPPALLIVIVLVLVLVIDLQSWPTRSWGQHCR